MDFESNASTKSNLMVSDRERQTVFMNGMGVLSLLLALYALAQLYALLFIDDAGLLEPSIFIVSIIISLSICALLAWMYLRFRLIKATAPNDPQIYRLMILATAMACLASLVQVHLVGSQNSLHYLLIVAILLVVSWFFHWREVVVFYLLANLGLVLVVAMEVKGVLDYAPLFVQRESLADIFLDWRIILGQAINYLLVLGASTALLWKLRFVLEKSERLRIVANRALQQEIDERVRSEKEKEKLIARLQASLDQVKTLHGLLPICMNCKKIRDDKGYWRQVEIYLKEHSPEVEFSHGLCPECIEKMYPPEIVIKG